MSIDKIAFVGKHIAYSTGQDLENRHVGNTADVAAKMVFAYVLGVANLGRPISGVDGLIIMQLIENAKSATEKVEQFDTAYAAAKLALARVCWMNPEAHLEPKANQPDERSGEELYHEMMQAVGGDMNKLEGVEWPEHWLVSEGHRFNAYAKEIRDKTRAMLMAENAERLRTGGYSQEEIDNAWGPDGDYVRNAITGERQKHRGDLEPISTPLMDHLAEREAIAVWDPENLQDGVAVFPDTPDHLAQAL